MIIKFYKYHGAGNDFILIDNREYGLPVDDQISYASFCDRHFGIGADGLMFLQGHEKYDFEMIYFNADGNLSSMCGNGGRCIVAFARQLGLVQDMATFIAVDGVHEATIDANNYVKLKMNDVSRIESINGHYFLDTGSPHHVEFQDHLSQFDVFNKGKEIRYSEDYEAIYGTNVNFVEDFGDKIFVRTYERGVENETMACGTGVVASAISAALHRNNPDNPIDVEVRGGSLKVGFDMGKNSLVTNVWLEGPAEFVFSGEIAV